MVITDFGRSNALVGHMVVQARHTGFEVRSLGPHFKFGMLRFVLPRPGSGLRPVREVDLVEVVKCLVRFDPFVSRKGEPFLVTGKVVLHVTL